VLEGTDFTEVLKGTEPGIWLRPRLKEDKRLEQRTGLKPRQTGELTRSQNKFK
jgi:hypothetical protein